MAVRILFSNFALFDDIEQELNTEQGKIAMSIGDLQLSKMLPIFVKSNPRGLHSYIET